MMKNSQAECLLQIVMLAKNLDWKVPSGRDLARRLYPKTDFRDPKQAALAIRKATGRRKTLESFVPALAGRPPRIDPGALVSNALSAYYLLKFYNLAGS